MNTINENLSQIILNAEKAVNSIGDAELKKIAFDRTLEHLFKIGGSQSSDGKKESHKTQVTKAKNNGAVKPGPKTWIQELIDEDFFKLPRTNGSIRESLDGNGHILKASDITNPLASLVSERKLRRTKMVVESTGKTQVHWVNW